MEYSWKWTIFFEVSPEGGMTYLAMFGRGLSWTLATASCAWLIALAAGIVIGVARTADNRPIAFAARAYVELFRNIPILVQLFLWYFVLPEVLPERLGTGLKQLDHASFYTAVVGIGLYMSSRVAEQVRAGIRALPRGQLLAGTAMGFTRLQTYRYVLLPVALRIVIPPLTSELLATIKNTTIALTIGLPELTGSARSMQEYSFHVFEAFIAATLIYLGLNLGVTYTMRSVEKRARIPGMVTTA